MKVIKHASINLLVCLFACLFVERVSAQGSCAAIGSASYDVGYSIIQTSDGGYAITGLTNSFGQGGVDVYVVKLDSSGNIQWTKTIGGANSDRGYSIIQTSDGGYAITGDTWSFGQGGVDVYVVKLDSSGNIQWTKTIGGANSDAGWSIIQTSDGGYAITGDTWSFGQGGADVYVVKLDSSGNIQWTKTIGGVNNDRGWSIIQTSDGGYAIAGDTWSFGQGGADVYVVKLDSSRNIQWTKTIGGASDDYGRSIIQTSDGGYAIAGMTYSFGQGWYDVYVVKLDGSGNIQWTKTIGGANSDAGWSIIQTSDGGYAIAGITWSFGQGGADVYVVKLDSNGNIAVSGCACVQGTGGTASKGGTANTGGAGGTGGTAGTGGILGSPISGITSCGVLPLAFLRLEAEPVRDGSIHLRWEYEGEAGEWFVVERQPFHGEWQTVGRVPFQHYRREYIFTDRELTKGIYFYRVGIQMADGTFLTYSPVREVQTRNDGESIQAWWDGKTLIVNVSGFLSGGGPLEIVLYSVDGREIWREEVRKEGAHEFSLRLNVPLREGVYMLKVKSGSMKREWTKVVVWQK